MEIAQLTPADVNWCYKSDVISAWYNDFTLSLCLIAQQLVVEILSDLVIDVIAMRELIFVTYGWPKVPSSFARSAGLLLTCQSWLNPQLRTTLWLIAFHFLPVQPLPF